MSKATSLSLLLGIALLALSCALVAAETNPNEYYSFRVNSGLPGMMFAVTPEGQLDFSGALQQNVPVAYTPYWGNFIVNADAGSNDSGLPSSLTGSEVNGTAFLGVGFLGSGHGLYVDTEATSDKGEGATSFQYQLVAAGERTPAVALGVMDVFNERDRYVRHPSHDARSFYATATTRLLQMDWRPVYLTAGWGNGRFRRGFGGFSVPLNDNFKVVAEYDGFGPNAGVAWSLNGAYNEKSSFDVIGYVGYTDLKRPALGLSVTFK
ncbi:MAG TPA: hypothetical protein VGM19_06305 [Armatimonadota bacterium]|jgi:hypothetical protein